MALRDASDKQAKALALHVSGASYDQIAKVLGYATKSGAHKAVKAALRSRIPTEGRLEAYRVEAARLDLVITSLSAAVRSGDTKSIALFLAASERRTVLAGLMETAPGAGVPANTGAGVKTPIDELHDRRAARGTVRGAARGAVPPRSDLPAVHED